MITFGMSTSLLVLRDWLGTYKNEKDNYINYPTSNSPDSLSSSVANSQSSLSRFGMAGKPSSFISTPGFVEIFWEFNWCIINNGNREKNPIPREPAIPPVWKTMAPIGWGISSTPNTKNTDSANKNPDNEITQANIRTSNTSSSKP